MLSTKIKQATKTAHQNLEKQVVLKLKAIRNHADYAEFLKRFYSYFNMLEKAIKPYLTQEVLPDYSQRRTSSYLKDDIEALGSDTVELPLAAAPKINSEQEALGALYVMEGSVMGGSIIVQMLAKHGITDGISFFSGYGPKTNEMWTTFTQILNTRVNNPQKEKLAIDAAKETFSQFAKVF